MRSKPERPGQVQLLWPEAEQPTGSGKDEQSLKQKNKFQILNRGVLGALSLALLSWLFKKYGTRYLF